MATVQPQPQGVGAHPHLLSPQPYAGNPLRWVLQACHQIQGERDRGLVHLHGCVSHPAPLPRVWMQPPHRCHLACAPQAFRCQMACPQILTVVVCSQIPGGGSSTCAGSAASRRASALLTDRSPTGIADVARPSLTRATTTCTAAGSTTSRTTCSWARCTTGRSTTTGYFPSALAARDAELAPFTAGVAPAEECGG